MGICHSNIDNDNDNDHIFNYDPHLYTEHKPELEKNIVYFPNHASYVGEICIVLTFGTDINQNTFRASNALKSFHYIIANEVIEKISLSTTAKWHWLSDRKVVIMLPFVTRYLYMFPYDYKVVRIDYEQKDYYNIIDTSFLFELIG
jgi:hypothetical protein